MALNYLAEEAGIAWAFNRRDLTATVVPFSFFTIASCLSVDSIVSTLATNTGNSSLLSFLLLYSFTISNQINGIDEDRLNKPDRPIVSGRVSLRGAYIRYNIVSVACLVLSHAMNVLGGASMFLLFGAIHNFTRASSFGPTKDLCTTAVLTSGLYTAWELGGGPAPRGKVWVICVAINLLFTISIQDLRDVIGDAAAGRYTTPCLIGKPYDRVYIAMAMLVTRCLTLKRQYLEGYNHRSHVSTTCAALVVMIDAFLVIRMFRFQSIAEDKKTYRFYMLRFSLELLLSAFIFSA